MQKGQHSSHVSRRQKKENDSNARLLMFMTEQEGETVQWHSIQ